MVDTPKSTNALQHLLSMIAPQAMAEKDTGYQPPQTIDVNGVQTQVPALKNSQSAAGASKGGGLGDSSGMPIMSPDAWMKQGAGNFTIPGAPPIPGAPSQGKGGILGSQGGKTGKGGGG